MQRQRLDKWLWCARLVRTRPLGSRLIAAGKVRVNGQRSLKPSRQVQAGDVITGAHLGRLFIVRVTGTSERRVSAAIARSLYEDLTPPDLPRQSLAEGAPRRGRRPTKRDRRRIDALKPEEL